MKSYTDIEQSRKLAEILSIESADMCFNISQRTNMPPLMTPYCKFKEFFNMGETPDFLIPCWSLAALLNYMREIDYFPDILADEYSVEMSVIYYDDEEGNTLHPLHKISVEEETFVDAVVNLIVKLKEKDLI